MDYITDKIVKKMIQQGPYSSIPKLLKFTHFDKDHPENHNLAITNVNQNMPMKDIIIVANTAIK